MTGMDIIAAAFASDNIEVSEEEMNALDARVQAQAEASIFEEIAAREAARKDAVRAGTLPKRYRGCTLENYDYSRIKDSKTAKEKIKKYLDKYDEGEGLILMGPVGTGKTHVAAALANLMIDENRTVCFGSYKSHLEKMQADIASGSGQVHLKEMQTADLLILDDVGREKLSEYTFNTLYSVINARYEEMLSTIITTNLTPEELVSYLGDACYSRIYETCKCVVLDGKDHRKEGKI